MKNITISILVFFFIGCGTLGHQKFYTQSSPTKYPKTDHVYVFYYGKVDLNKMKEAIDHYRETVRPRPDLVSVRKI